MTKSRDVCEWTELRSEDWGQRVSQRIGGSVSTESRAKIIIEFPARSAIKSSQSAQSLERDHGARRHRTSVWRVVCIKVRLRRPLRYTTPQVHFQFRSLHVYLPWLNVQTHTSEFNPNFQASHAALKRKFTTSTEI